LQVNWDIVFIAASVAAVFTVAGIMYQKWLDTMGKRPMLIRDGSIVGEYMERYCAKTATPIDAIVLVTYEISDRETVFRIEQLDKYPEIWLGDDE
jgi:hypothetical protein